MNEMNSNWNKRFVAMFKSNDFYLIKLFTKHFFSHFITFQNFIRGYKILHIFFSSTKARNYLSTIIMKTNRLQLSTLIKVLGGFLANFKKLFDFSSVLS